MLSEGQPNATGIDVWGPAPAPITILRGRHRRRFLVRSDRNVDLSAFLAAWKERVKLPSAVRVTLDVEPYQSSCENKSAGRWGAGLRWRFIGGLPASVVRL